MLYELILAANKLAMPVPAAGLVTFSIDFRRLTAARSRLRFIRFFRFLLIQVRFCSRSTDFFAAAPLASFWARGLGHSIKRRLFFCAIVSRSRQDALPLFIWACPGFVDR